MCIRQVAALLGYGEPQILYWVFFPIEDLLQAVAISKRSITKEKEDRQLAGQSAATQFMSIKEG